jgi:hypothetical protein
MDMNDGQIVAYKASRNEEVEKNIIEKIFLHLLIFDIIYFNSYKLYKHIRWRIAVSYKLFD